MMVVMLTEMKSSPPLPCWSCGKCHFESQGSPLINIAIIIAIGGVNIFANAIIVINIVIIWLTEQNLTWIPFNSPLYLQMWVSFLIFETINWFNIKAFRSSAGDCKRNLRFYLLHLAQRGTHIWRRIFKPGGGNIIQGQYFLIPSWYPLDSQVLNTK